MEVGQQPYNIAKGDPFEEVPDYDYEYEEVDREESQSEKRQANGQESEKAEEA